MNAPLRTPRIRDADALSTTATSLYATGDAELDEM
jgi:hypothetical protein